MRHTCHAEGCEAQIPPKLFVCRRHWRMLPEELQDAIWAEYRPGQEKRKDPSRRYLAIQHMARAMLVMKDPRFRTPRGRLTVTGNTLSHTLIQQAVAYWAAAREAGEGDCFVQLGPWATNAIERGLADAAEKAEAEGA